MTLNETRTKGLVLLTIGLLITGVIIGVGNLAFGEGNWHFIGYGFAVPGALALVGLIQLVGGVPFAELALKWDELQGWQRGVLGVLFVGAASSVIIICLLIFAKLMYG